MRRLMTKENMLKIVCLSFLPVIIFTSAGCKQERLDIFKKDVPERVAEKTNELKVALLASPNGYKIVYFPNNKKYGGFTFLMQFDDANKVKMVADIDSETTIPKVSDYSIRFGNSVQLVFDTWNYIHRLSDNENPQNLIGKGYEGSSTFEYQRLGDDGKIYFKEFKNGMDFILEPLNDPADDKYLETWAKSMIDDETLKNALLPSATSPIFQIIKLNDGQNSKDYYFAYDASLKFATLDRDDLKENEQQSFGIAYAKDSFIISPPLKIGKESVSVFTIDAVTKLPKAEAEGGVSAKIEFSATLPDFVPSYMEDLNEIVDENYFIAILNPRLDGVNTSMSTSFLRMSEEVSENLEMQGIEDYNLAEIVIQKEQQKVILSFEGIAKTRINFNFNQKPGADNKLLYLEYEGPSNNNTIDIENEIWPFIDFLSSPGGLYFVLNNSSYSTDWYSYDVNSGTLTSLLDPNIRAYLYLEPR